MTKRKKLSSIATPRFKLTEALARIPVAPFPRHSRIHPLRSFSKGCYVKRDDELGFGISGTKVRKYLSMLPALLKDKPDEAILIGSAYSNHVLSFSQLLRENGIKPILFLLGDASCKRQGNLLYASLMADPGQIHWVSRSQWDGIDQIAENFARERRNKKICIVPKGANCTEALPGALTLALDIIRNEEESGIVFDHLIIDSGTGMTVCALALAFAYLQKDTLLHIVQIAGDEEGFHEVLAQRQKDFEVLIGESVPSPTRFKFYPSSIAPSFGAVNAAVFQMIAEIARNEGFLTDPVFTAKMFAEGKKILAEPNIRGNVLFIHSGGGLGLTGFQEEMAKIFQLKS